MKFTSDPWLHTDFMRKKVGQAELERMAVIAYSAYKWSKRDQDACLIHLIEQWRIMSERRRAGETGAIHYVGWTPLWTK